MTTVPAALDGIINAVRSAPAMNRVDVLYGPWLDRPSAEDVIVVGWRPDEGNTVDFEETAAGLNSDEESYDVIGLVSSWNGNSDVRGAVIRADELIESIRTVLRDDPTLTGAVTRAQMRSRSLSPYQTSQGAECAVEFVIHVNAYRT